MTELHSPYRPGDGARPAALVGRSTELDRIMAVLTRVASTGQPAAAPLVFTGVLGIGKTVLLDYCADQATALGFLVVNVGRLDATSDCVSLVLHSIEQTVAQVRSRPAIPKALIERLAGLQVEINAGLVRVSSAAPDTGSRVVTRRSVLTQLLAQTTELARAQQMSGLVIIIDDIQQTPRADLVVLANVLEDLLRRPIPAVVCLAGLPNTPEVLVGAAAFAEHFEYRELPALSDDQAYLALAQPAQQLGVAWRAEAADLVLTSAAGLPFLIQRFGDHIWSLASRHGGDWIGVADARRGLRDAIATLGGKLRGGFAERTPRQQAFLLAMAVEAGPDGSAAIGAIAARLCCSVANLSSVRSTLLDAGVVRRAGHGRLAFCMPGFGQFLLAEGTDLITGAAPGAAGPATDGPTELEGV